MPYNDLSKTFVSMTDRIIITSFFLLIAYLGLGQRLSNASKDSIVKIMDVMSEDDQKHRWQIMLGEFDSIKLDSLKNLPSEIRMERILEVQKDKVGFGKLVKDSLWALQNKLDSLNEVRFIKVIQVYGYPSFRRIGSKNASILLTHLTDKIRFNRYHDLLKMELEKGNLPPSEYASWYDRCQLTMKNQQLYGEYDKIYPCVENLTLTNYERKKIGLKKLKVNNCR